MISCCLHWSHLPSAPSVHLAEVLDQGRWACAVGVGPGTAGAARGRHPATSRGPSGGRLGIDGFGGSAHITAQVAIAEGAEVHVLTRSAAAPALALELGAASVGGAAVLRMGDAAAVS